MPRRIIAFVVLAAVLAAVFVRLGFWQLDRRVERRTANAAIEARFSLPEAPIDVVTRDSTPSYRRAAVRGTPDTANEFWIAGRSRNGSPGVHLMTPMRLRGADTAVLVNRGWVYAPDAATADLPTWRERRDEYRGFVMDVPSASAEPHIKGRALRPLSIEGVRRMLPYPVLPVYVVAQDSAPNAPARLPTPALDEGPHLNYAIQWFCFAAIAVGGAAIVTFRAREGSRL